MPTPIGNFSNGESGASIRTKLNSGLTRINLVKPSPFLRISVVGDSIASQTYQTPHHSWVEVACIKSMGRLLRITNRAVPGKRADQVLTEQLPLSVADPIDAVLDNSGINDLFNSESVSTVIARKQTNADYIASYGLLPIIPCLLPYSATLNTNIMLVNEAMKAWCAKKGYVFLDFFSTIANAAGGTNFATQSNDLLHPDTAGAITVADAALAEFAKLNLGGDVPLGSEDTVSLRNWFPNGVTMAGASTAAPTGWYTGTNAGTTPVFSRAAEDGLAKWFVVTSNDSATIQDFYSDNYSADTYFSVGDRVAFSFRAQITPGTNYQFRTFFWLSGLNINYNIISITAANTGWAGTISDGIFYDEIIVPNGVTAIQYLFKIQGIGTTKIARPRMLSLNKVGAI